MLSLTSPICWGVSLFHSKMFKCERIESSSSRAIDKSINSGSLIAKKTSWTKCLSLFFLSNSTSRNAYNMVLHKRGELLYSNLVAVITEHLQKKAGAVSQTNEAEFLASVQRIWDSHTISMQMIRDILMYMVSPERTLASFLFLFSFFFFCVTTNRLFSFTIRIARMCNKTSCPLFSSWDCSCSVMWSAAHPSFLSRCVYFIFFSFGIFGCFCF